MHDCNVWAAQAALDVIALGQPSPASRSKFSSHELSTLLIRMLPCTTFLNRVLVPNVVDIRHHKAFQKSLYKWQTEQTMSVVRHTDSVKV